MKKALALTAVTLAAFLSQGAAIKWTSGTIYDAVSSETASWGTNKAKGTVNGVLFLIANELDAAYDGTYVKSASESNEDYYKRLYNAYKDGTLEGAALEKSSVLTSNNGGAITYTDTTATSNGKYAYAVAIFTTSYDGKELFIANGSSAGVTLTGTQQGGTGIAASVAQWQAVPEPTTVALLALGLAAVGLKRKVA